MEVRERMASLPATVRTELYVTDAPGDATRYVADRCRSAGGELLRFYACGGDGTLNEVVSGAMGFECAEVTCLPVGSGNDYVKYYGGMGKFLDLQSLVDGEVHRVDVMRVGDRYALNVCNFGFDSVVCRTMMEVRRMPIIGGRNSYTTGILKALFTGRRTRCRVAVDGSVVHDGDLLFSTMGNGRYVGGAYMCSPLSLNDDGLIEVCIFKPLPLWRFAQLLKSYRDGSFIDRPDVQSKMTYLRGKTIDIESSHPIDVCLDGEILSGDTFHIEQMPQALRFVVPERL